MKLFGIKSKEMGKIILRDEKSAFQLAQNPNDGFQIFDNESEAITWIKDGNPSKLFYTLSSNFKYFLDLKRLHEDTSSEQDSNKLNLEDMPPLIQEEPVPPGIKIEPNVAPGNSLFSQQSNCLCLFPFSI